MEYNETTHVKKVWELKPRCIGGDRCTAYVNTGHLSPCCWVDGHDVQTSKEYKDFFTEEMKLANFDSVQDVLDTDVWVNFFRMLIENPKEAPWICWKYCGEYSHTPNQNTPNRDIFRTKEYFSLKEKYSEEDMKVKAKCTDGIRAKFMPRNSK